MFFAGLTANPTDVWITQAAHNLSLRHADQLDAARAVVRDRGSQFIDVFDEIDYERRRNDLDEVADQIITPRA